MLVYTGYSFLQTLSPEEVSYPEPEYPYMHPTTSLDVCPLFSHILILLNTSLEVGLSTELGPVA